jgi:DNA-binding response OmpR family regulator
MPAAQILLVDDDPWIVRMVTSVLSKRGHRVYSASDGEQGLRRALELHPDLIISDVMMPKLDGWALLRALRAHPELAQTPVLLLTALSTDEDRIRGLRLGADDYLAKPFRFEELDLRVASTLRKRRQPDPAPGSGKPQPPAPGHAAPTSNSEGHGTLSGVHGSLEQLSLGSLLAMIEMERKSGILVVQRGIETGRLVCRAGRVLAAELLTGGLLHSGGPAERGVEVLFQMLAWHSGRFDFSSGEVHADDEIGTQITHLLMEGARRMDEAEAEAESAVETAAAPSECRV